ncbi:MAG: DNA replication complex GINS family protein [Candidatus Bathyarchaeota archaeon]|nr:MAG: DNA replication complex GINS family protein [Candidatus Bathyarchaeota archaeon]
MYDLLYKAWKKERENVDVQTLPQDFYAKLADYVKRIKKERRMLDEKTAKARLMQREFVNVRKTVSELVQLRYEKTLQNTLKEKTMRGVGLTSEEEKLVEGVSLLVEPYHLLAKDILKGHLSHVKRKEQPKKKLVRLLQEVPAIVGSDMKTYGPFKPENIATLPSENARILIRQSVAVEVEA